MALGIFSIVTWTNTCNMGKWSGVASALIATIVFDILLIIATVTMGALASQGILGSSQSAPKTMIALFSIASFDVILNTVLIGIGCVITEEDNEESELRIIKKSK